MDERNHDCAHKRGGCWFVLADKSDWISGVGVCNGDICGDAVELMVADGYCTLNWFVIVNLGSHIPYMTTGQAPYVSAL